MFSMVRQASINTTPVGQYVINKTVYREAIDVLLLCHGQQTQGCRPAAGKKRSLAMYLCDERPFITLLQRTEGQKGIEVLL